MEILKLLKSLVIKILKIDYLKLYEKENDKNWFSSE